MAEVEQANQTQRDDIATDTILWEKWWPELTRCWLKRHRVLRGGDLSLQALTTGHQEKHLPAPCLLGARFDVLLRG